MPLALQGKPALASTEVGSYLPSAGVDDFVLFVPDKAKTPAIRAGTVDRANPYRFAIPPSWSERKVANIASGELLPGWSTVEAACLSSCASCPHVISARNPAQQ